MIHINATFRFSQICLLCSILLFSASSCSTPSPTITSKPTIEFTSTSIPSASPAARSTPTPVNTPIPQSPSMIATLGKGLVHAVEWTPDHHTAAVSTEEGIGLYNLETGTLTRTIPLAAYHLLFSPDGRFLIGMNEYGDHQLFDLSSNAEAIQLEGGRAWFLDNEFAFARDGSAIAVIKSIEVNLIDPPETWIEVYDMASHKLVHEFGHRGSEGLADKQYVYEEIDISPDNHWLAAADSAQNQIHIWDLVTGKLVRALSTNSGVLCVTFSPDGRWLASGHEDNTIRLWTAASGTYVRSMTGFPNDVTGLTFSSDSTKLTVDIRETIGEIRDVQTGQKLGEVEEQDPETALEPFLIAEGYRLGGGIPQFNPDGTVFAVPNGSKVQLWDLGTQKPVGLIDDQVSTSDRWSDTADTVEKMAFGPDGEWLAIGQEDGSVNIWHVSTQKYLKNIPSQKSITLGFSPNGETMVIGGNQTVELWDVKQGTRRWEYIASELAIHYIRFSQDGKFIVAASRSGKAVLWLDAQTGKLIQSFSPTVTISPFVQISLQDKLLALLNDKDSENVSIQVWDLTTGQVLRDIGEFVYDYWSPPYFALSRDGRLIATTNGSVTQVWSTATGKEVYEFPSGYTKPLFSADGTKAVLMSDKNQLELWDTRSLAGLAPPLPKTEISGFPTIRQVQTPTVHPSQAESNSIRTTCLLVSPTLPTGSDLKGKMVLRGEGLSGPYLLDFPTGSVQSLSDQIWDISTSPDGTWLAYVEYSDDPTGDDWLVFENPRGIQTRFRKDKDWLFPVWLGNENLAYNMRAGYGRWDPIPSVQIISPVSGPQEKLPSNYPDLIPYCGMSCSPYHFGGSSVEYDRTLRMVVYIGTTGDTKSIILWDRHTGIVLASIEIYGWERNPPLWSADGEFFVVPVQISGNEETSEWFRVSREGEVEQITRFSEDFTELRILTARLSPDGRLLAFTFSGISASTTEKTEGLAILDMNTHTVTDYCLPNTIWSPIVWSPDSRYVLVGQEYESAIVRTILIDLEEGWAAQAADEASPEGWLSEP